MDTLGGIDLVIGSPAMREIDATLEFRKHRLRFKHTTFVANLTKSITLQPKQIKVLSLTARLPSFLRNANLFLRTSNFISQFTASNMLVKFHNGFASIVLSNPMDYPVSFTKHKPFGIIDLRNLTEIYTPVYATAVSQNSTQFLCYSAVPNSVGEDGQSLDQTDLPQTNCNDRIELHKAKSKKYPFLDNTDSRLKMTDNEILDRDITFHKSPLDPDQQVKVKKLLLKYKDALSLHSEVGNTNLTIDLD
jgi:hypothetical protein